MLYRARGKTLAGDSSGRTEHLKMQLRLSRLQIYGIQDRILGSC